MKDREKFQDDHLLDWIEGTMSPQERARMQALPDHEPETPGEIERRERLASLLSSIPAQSAPANLWADLQHRIDKAPAESTSPGHGPVAIPVRVVRRVLAHRKAVAGLAAVLLLAVTFFALQPELFRGSQPGIQSGQAGGKIDWVVIDESDLDLSLEDQTYYRALVGAWPGEENGSPDVMYGELLEGTRP